MAVIGLVACVTKKRETASPAKDLYISDLFKKSRIFVESNCDKWFILSAKYGLLLPEQVIEPYNKTLISCGKKKRIEWSESVFQDISKHIQPGDEIVFLAGKIYREFLIPKLRAEGVQIKVPMEGLRIGEQMQWLNEKNQRNNHEH